ncbi:MAG TPA: bifunctional 4-hydroxy-2-oxoglutarate aldolase/2-dehydro-3-deoxy-phosphogluconate aldolase [Coleofasciculaceae cyanobacterium]
MDREDCQTPPPDRSIDLATVRSQWADRLARDRAIAVIRATDWEQGLAMAQAAADGGLRLIEITWNSVRPAELVAELRDRLPGCQIGAGTLLDAAMVREAVAAGAQFGFAPFGEPGAIAAAVVAGMPIVPGALTPTEIAAAWQAGASSVKVFPISAVGGPSYVRSLVPVLPIPLIPTGGVTLANAADFLAAGAMAIGLAGELFPAAAVAAGNWSIVRDRAQKLVEQVSPHCLRERSPQMGDSLI